MVAAWINADTGVGPSIASGSHTCSGICADLPTAPPKINTAARVSSGPASDPVCTAAKTASNCSDPTVKKSSRIPRNMKKSPTRVVTNAFIDARAAAGRSNQNPISR